MDRINHQKNFSGWFWFVAVWGVLLLHGLWSSFRHVEQLPYSQLLAAVEQGQVVRAVIAEKLCHLRNACSRLYAESQLGSA